MLVWIPWVAVVMEAVDQGIKLKLMELLFLIMNINDHDFTLIAKNTGLKISIILEHFFEKHLQMMTTLLKKVKTTFFHKLGRLLGYSFKNHCRNFRE